MVANMRVYGDHADAIEAKHTTSIFNMHLYFFVEFQSGVENVKPACHVRNESDTIHALCNYTKNLPFFGNAAKFTELLLDQQFE